MLQIIELTGRRDWEHAPLYHSHRNQLRRAIGKFAVVYCGGVEGGTVKAESDGKMYDWWFTETVLSGNFKLIRIVEAR